MLRLMRSKRQLQRASAAIAASYRNTLKQLGYTDPDDPHLKGSPARVARFLLEWHTNGEEPPKLTTFPANGYDQIIVVKDIRFYSMCAHHGLPFIGTAAVAYIPRRVIVGLSKVARAVDHFARRYQTQEVLSSDIACYLSHVLAPKALGVVLRAEHLCMSMRGIERPGHETVTSEVIGRFREDPASRAEMFKLIGGTS